MNQIYFTAMVNRAGLAASMAKGEGTGYNRAGCELLSRSFIARINSIDGRQQQIKTLTPYFINSIISYFVKY